MWPHANVEEVTPRIGDHVFVGGDARGLQAFAGDLLQLVAHHVRCGRELLAWQPLLSAVIDPDLRVWDTAAVAGLGVRLSLLPSVAPGGTPSHLCLRLGTSLWRRSPRARMT